MGKVLNETWRANISRGVSRARWRMSKFNEFKDKLPRWYLKEGMSTRDIAKPCDVDKASVTRWLKKLGIPLRGNSSGKLAKKGIFRRLEVPIRQLITEDMLINYIIHRKEQFGYKEIYLLRNKLFDLLCLTMDDVVERVEVEVSVNQFNRHDHECDKVIAYYPCRKTQPKVPVIFVNREDYINFVEDLMIRFEQYNLKHNSGAGAYRNHARLLTHIEVQV